MTALEFARMPQVMEQGKEAAQAAGGGARRAVLARRRATSATSRSGRARRNRRAGGLRAPQRAVAARGAAHRGRLRRPGRQAARHARIAAAARVAVPARPVRVDRLPHRRHRGASAGSRSTCVASPGDPRSCGWASASRSDYEGGATANAAAQTAPDGPQCARCGMDRSTAQIGEEPRFMTEFYQPLSLRVPVFVAPAVPLRTADAAARRQRRRAHRALSRARNRRSRSRSGGTCRTGAKCVSGCVMATAAAGCWSAIPALPSGRVRPRWCVRGVRLRPARQRLVSEARPGVPR